MRTINASERVKEIEPFQLFETNISILLHDLLDDFDQAMDQENFDHSYKKLTYLLLSNYKTLLWGEILFVFSEITAGKYDIKKVSVVNIMSCFDDFFKKKIEKNRFEIEKRENEIIKNAVDCTRLPLGQAILFRIDMHEKGKNEWWDVPLKEIAQKLASGEIKFDYKEEKAKTILSNHFTK